MSQEPSPTNGPARGPTQPVVMAQVILRPDGKLFLAMEQSIDDKVGFCHAVAHLAINAAGQMRELKAKPTIQVAPPGMKVPRTTK